MVLLIIVGVFFCFSCEEDDGLVSVNDDNLFETNVDKNSPRITKENGSFAYVLKGSGYSGNSSEAVKFDNENVTITINLEDYKTGNCTITIKSDYTNELFEKEMSGNLIYSEDIQLDDHPEQVIIEVEEFTGTLKFALVEAD